VADADDENPLGGARLKLQTEAEREWFISRRDRYLTDNRFVNVSDLQDLDRLLVLEIMVYRWSLWLGQGFDYLFTRIDENALKDSLKGYSTELRLLKANLGIDKATRDKDKGANVAEYIENLLIRAKEFGYHRNEQYAHAVTLLYHLRSMVLTYDRCDEEERRLLELSPESILNWIRTEVIAPWDAMSEEFRKNQAIWVRSL
jgi:hypothetical protein